ncbi:MAG TPA: 30S ribosomal protein S1 [Bdellovibrionota bacterium]|nr:30S ribosomal protein S1 [Bdellovibrionota bacterium]
MQLQAVEPTKKSARPADEESFEKLFLESIQSSKEIKEGEIVPGKIMKIGPEFVTVDIGYKSEGQIPIQEFMDPKGTILAQVGDQIDVFLVSTEDEEGLVILSKEKADKLKIWDEIAEACEKGEVVEGRIVQRVKGGVSVDIGVQAFLPGSQIDLAPARDLDNLIGKTFQFKIIKFNKMRGNIVLSRRVLLEQERQVKREQTLGQLVEGSTMQGTVKNITDYGAFIDLGGIDGLLHITDISWKRVNHPSEVLKVGDSVNVKVLKFETEKERVSLGMKQLTEDPWAEADMKYPKNSRVKGKVVSLTDYGAFIEVEEGIEGLIHVSEMSWTKRVKHPSAILKVSEMVETVVLDIDKDNRRMSLGLKQTQPNPWDELVKKYPPGTKVTTEIRNITDFGLFVAIEEGIDGLIHISDLSWSSKIKNPHDVYKKGDKVEAVVLNVDPSAERFSLGIKQISEDPWAVAVDRYPLGTPVEGEIVKLAEFGLFVKVEEDLEGLVHISEVADEKVANLAERFKVGDKITAMVLSIDPEERKMSLSIKSAQHQTDRQVLAAAQAKQTRKKPTLGDVMEEGLKKKPRQKKKKEAAPEDESSA